MNSSSSLPIELIQLILSHLPKSYLTQLLINPPNHDWLYATASVVYRKLAFTRFRHLSTCCNLFEQTRQRRQQQLLDSTKDGKHGFYSTMNYSVFVRQIDLSLLRENDKLNDSLLTSLTLDCQRLSNLNLYNCYTLTTDAMVSILLQCPQLERLSLAGATGIDVSCFLDSRVLSSACQQLRVLNLNLHPLFFNPSATIFAKYKRWFRNNKSIPRFPKLQELKLGSVYQQKRHLHDTSLFRLMILRCANIDTLWMFAMSRPYITICLEHCRQIRSITFRQCYFYKGMFTSLLSQYQQHHHSMERLEMDHCFEKTDSMDRIWDELMAADFRRLAWLNCNKMAVPLDLLDRMVSGYYLTRFDCPDSMTDTALLTLMTRCPSLTHLSICMFWTQSNTHGYRYDPLRNKRTVLTLPVLIQAITTWKSTLEWLAITEGRHGRDNGQHLSKKIEHSFSEQRQFIDYLYQWTDNKIQVLLLGGMGLPLSMDTLERLAGCFPRTRYLSSFVAEESLHTDTDLEHAMASWKQLDGFLCVNQSALMERRDDLWLTWKWMDSKKDQFTQWQFHDLVSC